LRISSAWARVRAGDFDPAQHARQFLDFLGFLERQ
jgi:hypothetical protein